MANEEENLTSILEAILFIYGEPIKIKKLAEISEADEAAVEEALKGLSESLKSSDRGLNLMVADGKAVLVTKPELQKFVTKIIKEELDSELTPASLETLAIVAYLGPVARHEIDYIRGVNSSFILRNLMVRGLIQRDPTKDDRGNQLYSTTFDFLKHIGLNSQSELPDYSKYRELVRSFSQGPAERVEAAPSASTDENK